jgi:ribulose bisphosphate carboxylase small subunit
MRITQGTFSYLPDLSEAQIEAQLRYALRQGWAIMSSTPTTRTHATRCGRCGRRRSSISSRTTSTSS